MSRKYIVTGGAGFIGSHIVARLLLMDHKVVIIDNLYAGFESFIPKHKDVVHVNADISNWAELVKHFPHFHDVDGVFHLAACSRIQPSILDPSITNDYNVTGTMNVLQLMRMFKIPNIVYSGSSSYYGNGASIPCVETDPGNPETPYAVTKYMGEEYCKTWGKIYGTRCAVLRYFNIYGKRSPLTGAYAPVIGLFFRQALLGNDITVVGDGKQRRDFTHVSDAVAANVLAMNKLSGPDFQKIDGQVFNIGTGTNNSVNEIAAMVKESLRNSVEAVITHIPARPGEARETLADNSKAVKMLDWEPSTSISEGIDDLRAYYLNNLDNIRNGIVDF
jgi:UDP-glucose 4-epimerase